MERPDFRDSNIAVAETIFRQRGIAFPATARAEDRAGRLRAARRIEATGRAADEAAARRKLRACPLANAEAACFVKRPRDPGGLRARGGPNSEPMAFGLEEPDQAGHRTSVQDLPDRKRGLGRRAVTGGEGASASCSPGRTGASAPGAAKPGRDPELRLMDLSGGTRASALDPAGRGTKGFGRRNRQGKEAGLRFQIRRTANRRGFGPDGEPAGESGLSFGSFRTPEDAGPGLRPWFPLLETARRLCLASQAGSDAKGQWGPAAMSAPITASGELAPFAGRALVAPPPRLKAGRLTPRARVVG